MADIIRGYRAFVDHDDAARPNVEQLTQRFERKSFDSGKFYSMTTNPSPLLWAFLAELAGQLVDRKPIGSQSRVLLVMPTREDCVALRAAMTTYHCRVHVMTTVDDPRDKKIVYAIAARLLSRNSAWLNGLDAVVLLDPRALGAVAAKVPRDVAALSGIAQTARSVIFIHLDGDGTRTKAACEALDRCYGSKPRYPLPRGDARRDAPVASWPSTDTARDFVFGMLAFLACLALIDDRPDDFDTNGDVCLESMGREGMYHNAMVEASEAAHAAARPAKRQRQ